MKTLLNKLFKRNRFDDFPSATKAYQESTYGDNLTKEEFRDRMIETLKRKIRGDIKFFHSNLDISTYSGYREKLVLPDVAEYFKSLSYHVDILNGDGYEDTNVLIISWQGLETFK